MPHNETRHSEPPWIKDARASVGGEMGIGIDVSRRRRSGVRGRRGAPRVHPVSATKVLPLSDEQPDSAEQRHADSPENQYVTCRWIRLMQLRTGPERVRGTDIGRVPAQEAGSGALGSCTAVSRRMRFGPFGSASR